MVGEVPIRHFPALGEQDVAELLGVGQEVAEELQAMRMPRYIRMQADVAAAA